MSASWDPNHTVAAMSALSDKDTATLSVCLIIAANIVLFCCCAVGAQRCRDTDDARIRLNLARAADDRSSDVDAVVVETARVSDGDKADVPLAERVGRVPTAPTLV